MQHTNDERVYSARKLLDELTLPLDTADVTRAREQVRSLSKQYDDYILPRLTALEAPLTVVVGGSTGAGKSTLVNTLMGTPVSRSSALRPTTRQPILLYRAEDSEYLTPERFLPTLERQEMASISETSPRRSDIWELPGAEHHLQDTLISVQTSALPRGIALIDAPDIDSVSDENRRLANELLSAADLWLFVTTANRYADAVPWDLLHRAAQRNIAVAVVLNRVPEGAADEIESDLMRMLTEAGITPVILHSIHEQPRDEQGMLPADAVAPLTSWFEQLGADAPARAAIARRTLAGAIAGAGNSLQELADAQTRQVETYTGLETAVTLAYEDALARVEDSLTDGSLLRGEVLARWHDFVGTGDFFRSLENRIGRLRDRFAGMLTGKPAATTRVEQALETGLHAVVLDAAQRAHETIRRSWGAERAGRVLLQNIDESPYPPHSTQARAELDETIAAEIRAWQSSVLDMIRAEGSSKRQRARVLSLGVNATAVLLMMVAFSATGGLTGIEIGIAGGSGVVGSKLLESVFGEDAVRRMATRARSDLVERLETLLKRQSEDYRQVLSSREPRIQPDEIRVAAEQLHDLGQELDHDLLARREDLPQNSGLVQHMHDDTTQPLPVKNSRQEHTR